MLPLPRSHEGPDPTHRHLGKSSGLEPEVSGENMGEDSTAWRGNNSWEAGQRRSKRSEASRLLMPRLGLGGWPPALQCRFLGPHIHGRVRLENQHFGPTQQVLPQEHACPDTKPCPALGGAGLLVSLCTQCLQSRARASLGQPQPQPQPRSVT